MVAYFYQHWDQPISVSMQDATDFPLHFHHQIELFYLIRGEQEMTVDSVKCMLHAGDAALVLPHAVHSFHNIQPGRSVVAVFDASYAGVYRQTLLTSACTFPFVREAHADVMLALLRLARDESLDEVLKTAYASVALGRLLSSLELTARGAASEADDLRRVLNYIDEHISGTVTLNAIADSLHMNRYAVSRLFSDRMGCGLSEYVNALRADKARSLLSEGRLSLNEIWHQSGFDSERTFYRAFRRQYGETPGKYCRTVLTPGASDRQQPERSEL